MSKHPPVETVKGNLKQFMIGGYCVTANVDHDGILKLVVNTLGFQLQVSKPQWNLDGQLAAVMFKHSDCSDCSNHAPEDYGLKNPIASQLGSKGGRSKSKAKQAASQRNGSKGGRPKSVT